MRPKSIDAGTSTACNLLAEAIQTALVAEGSLQKRLTVALGAEGHGHVSYLYSVERHLPTQLQARFDALWEECSWEPIKSVGLSRRWSER